jgi:uncharacterized protein YndB with AHSA1/START domain
VPKGVSIKRVLAAHPKRIFEAWTRPELMARWFFPGSDWSVTVSSDLCVGGRYELLMKETSGAVHRQFGEYREITPYSRLVFSWSCPAYSIADSLVTVELVECGEGTELSIVHELPPDPNVRRGHEEGWTGCLGNLEKLLASE